tara:strand:- start:1390 stop:1539 length:150 start_codon:yes stop_codon:yes gene_type:complete
MYSNQGLFGGIFTAISNGFFVSLTSFVSGLILGLLNPILTGIGFPAIEA